MKKLIKLALAGVLVATTLSACIVVPLGPGPGYYHNRGGYYGR